MPLSYIIEKDLLSNATLFDRMVANPSTDVLRWIWLVWAIITVLCCIVSLTIMAGIALSKTARKNAFNQIVVFICLPDFIFSFSCMLTCFFNYFHGKYYYGGDLMCEIQQIYTTFGITASMWMQLLVAKELLRLLRASKKLEHFKPPTFRAVLSQVSLVYCLSLFIGLWSLVDTIPIKARPLRGLVCLAINYDTLSTAFLWLVYMPSTALIPVSVIIGLIFCEKPWKIKMTDSTKAATKYFARILAVYLLMWIPTVILVLCLPSLIFIDVKLVSIGGSWGHLQGINRVQNCVLASMFSFFA
jgi:hypothetical protein